MSYNCQLEFRLSVCDNLLSHGVFQKKNRLKFEEKISSIEKKANKPELLFENLNL